MISFTQIRKFFVTIILAFMLAITIAFDFGTTNSWAATSSISSISPSDTQLIAVWGFGKAKATGKNIEGKAQEAVGNLTGDPKDQMMGKAKQIESQARNTAEDVKDKMQLQGRAKAVTKNIEGKVQETRGNVTGNRGDQFAGKAKQTESQARNAVEDVKEGVQDIFN
ncbi:CsbD family protein [Crocosphaera sp. XPORK-15E]|uniref:CsbD family protein n=1 Tax=Crocosphaera sp. XPORK-15E TaxID=3110247 RepID=UPI002B211CE7|nr:CsbD family protein [Crocosphaera sp. XPORK-15E]MEA5534656.1 CsbD family protein [Crocosphaera sp. XPORK-15E]